MKIMRVLFCISALLPGDKPVDIKKMRVGQYACVFPYYHTREGSIWVNKCAIYAQMHGHCILTLQRLPDAKWAIFLHGIPDRPSKTTTDSELESLKSQGFIKLGPASGVLR